MKINPIILFLFVFSLCACFDDKGNYSYHEVAEITIENIPEVVEVLGNSDHIVVNPKITSSLEGEIGADNANFEFSYKIEKKSGGSVDIWAILGRSEPFWLIELRYLGNFCRKHIYWVVFCDR